MLDVLLVAISRCIILPLHSDFHTYWLFPGFMLVGNVSLLFKAIKMELKHLQVAIYSKEHSIVSELQPTLRIDQYSVPSVFVRMKPGWPVKGNTSSMHDQENGE